MSGHSRRQIGRLAFYLSALASLVADQISKVFARQLMSFGDSVEVIPGFFSISLIRNYGAAFGILPDWAPLIIIVSFVVIFAIIKLRRARERSQLLAVALGLLLGGAIGNLIDRLFFGYVTDFLDFYVIWNADRLSWPTFNIADVAITLGAVLLLYYVYVIEKRAAD